MELTKKRIISTVFAVAVIALLYFSGPTTAISVALDAISGTFYPGQTVPMSATITLNDYEFIMTTGSAILTIQDPSSNNVTCSLPITGAVTNQQANCSNGRNITVTATSSNWGYDYGYGYRYGYKYDYAQTHLDYNYGYNYYSYGYGYSANNYWNATTLSYSIKWRIPNNATNGTYTASIRVYAGSTLIDVSAERSITVLSATQLPRTTVGVWISEFMPHSTNDSASYPSGEWVELSGTGNSTVNVSGWLIAADDGNRTISTSNTYSYSTGTGVASTLLTPSGFLVVYMNGALLDNHDDTVILKNASGTTIDSVGYNADDFWTAGVLSAVGDPFPAGWSIILQYGVNQSACTGVFIGGYCYSSTNSSTPGTTNPGSTASMSETLVNGYNLVSIPVILSNTTANSSFASLTGNYDIVWAYNASEANSSLRWKRYIPNNITANTLTTTNMVSGYWVRINASANQTLGVTGTAPSTTSQTLVGGTTYNLIGYPSNTARAVSTALGTITGNYDIVWMYNASNATVKWQRYMPNNITANTLTAMSPGFGYWVRVNASTNQTLIVTY